MPSLENLEMNVDEVLLEREKAELIKIYQELDELKLEEIDKKIDDLKLIFERRIKQIEELVEKENKDFANKREEEIKEKQRLGNDRFINYPYEVVKPKENPRFSTQDIIEISGLFLIVALLIVLIFTIR